MQDDAERSKRWLTEVDQSWRWWRWIRVSECRIDVFRICFRSDDFFRQFAVESMNLLGCEIDER